MKKIAIIAAIASVFAAGAAQAAGNGTISFSGTVVSQTCNASVNGTATPAAATVTLPTVQANVLSTTGNTAGQTAFNMTLSGCATTNPSGAGKVKAFFEQGPTVDANGRLTNQTSTGAASNVVLELVDSSNNPIKAGDSSQTANTGFATISSGAATLRYGIQYYATGTATAGSITSSVTYSLIYQ